jgi:hypothetical protein
MAPRGSRSEPTTRAAPAGFQRALASLRGLLLAIASKNDLAAVRDLFEKHPDMVLGLDDFAAVQIHWEDKASSLRAIARELNIGTDALAFYDDSPVEREWVRGQLPDVTVIEVPERLLERVGALSDSGAFDQLRISGVRNAGPNLTAKKGIVTPARAHGQSRVLAQSVDHRARRIAGRREPAARRPAHGQDQPVQSPTRRHRRGRGDARGRRGGVVAARDRYGDYGLVGVALAVPELEQTWRIDTFLLSCRALGRHVEGALLTALARFVARQGGRCLIGEFVATPHNRVTERFFAEHGFVSLDPAGRMWRLELDAAALEPPPFVALEACDEVDAHGG